MSEKICNIITRGKEEVTKDYRSLTAYKYQGYTSESYVMFSGDKVFGTDLQTPNPVTSSPYSGNVVELTTTGQYYFKLKAKVDCELVYYTYRLNSTDTNPRTPNGTISLSKNQEYSFRISVVEAVISSINIVATSI